MRMLNRNAAIIRPGQPYKDWIAGLDGSDPENLDAGLIEYPVYLLPEAMNDAHFKRILRKYFPFIFENELSGWSTDETTWPQKRGWKTFCAWFEVEYGSEVMDLSDAELRVEDL